MITIRAVWQKKSDTVRLPPFLVPYWQRLQASPIGYRLAKGAFWSLAGAVISRGLGLLASILVARMLGKVGFGELGIIQSTVGMFGVFAGFGLGVTATKHVAEFRAKDPKKAGRIIALSGIVAIVTGAVMSVALFVFAPWLAEHTLAAPQLDGLIRIGSLLLFLSALNGAQTGALAGFEAFRAIAQVNLLAGVAAFPLMVGGVWLWGTTGAVWALVVSMAINWLLNHLALRREAARYAIPFTLVEFTREWPVLLRFALPTFLTSSLVLPAMWACNTMLVNQPRGYAEMGILSAAQQWRFPIIFISGLLTQVGFPVVSERHALGSDGDVRKLLAAMVKMNCAVALPVMLILVCFSKQIMGWYGAEFKEGSACLIFIVGATCLQAIQSPAITVMQATGYAWHNFLLNLIWCSALLLGSYFGAIYGAKGLAAAQLVAFIIYTPFLFITSRRLSRRACKN